MAGNGYLRLNAMNSAMEKTKIFRAAVVGYLFNGISGAIKEGLIQMDEGVDIDYALGEIVRGIYSVNSTNNFEGSDKYIQPEELEEKVNDAIENFKRGLERR